jgi:diaminopimelate epimerase
MTIEFTKMQALGNDFVVIDAVRQSIDLTRAQVRFLADRHLGVGCDQLLVAEPSPDPEFDFRFRIYNADGGEVEQCGNGARAFARFLREKGLTEKTDIRVLTSGGPMTLHITDDGTVSVNMGMPVFEPANIPFNAPARQPTYRLELNGEPIEISALAIGNPHAVQEVENVDSAPVASQGPRIEAHPRFPRRVNAGFMQIVDGGRIRLRVYERGVGETLACGSGACAAAVAGIQLGKLDKRVQVEVQGGVLSVNWQGEGHPVWMSGPSTSVFEGRIELE